MERNWHCYEDSSASVCRMSEKPYPLGISLLLSTAGAVFRFKKVVFESNIDIECAYISTNSRPEDIVTKMMR